MMQPTPCRSAPVAKGFTLVELLVVMGIIALLLGILLPVVNSVRKSAYTADSRNQIRNVANAIDRYYNDFTAYPGLFSNADITAGVGASGSGTRKVTGLAINLTSSENLVLSLMGGINGPLATQSYTAGDIGRGPVTMGLTQKRMSPYIEATPQSLSIQGSTLDQGGIFGNGGMSDTGVNSGVPEFIDRFPGALPIIYLRARIGAAGIADASGSPDVNQYNPAHMQPYFTPYASSPAGISTTDFPANGTLTAGLQAYFGNASLSTAAIGVPKNKDTYMLISPGQDRKYGTADDICNFSF